MRGGNTLLIGLRADTSKLTADLAVAEGKLLNLKKTLRDAVKGGDESAIKISSEDLDKQTRKVSHFKDELKEARNRAKELGDHGQDLDKSLGLSKASSLMTRIKDALKSLGGAGATRDVGKDLGLERANSHASNLRENFKHFGSDLTGINGPLDRMNRVFQSMREIGGLGRSAFSGVKEVVDDLAATRNTSLGTGFSTDFVATVTNLLRETGKEGDGTNPRGALIQWMGAWGDARTMALTERRERERQDAQDTMDKKADPDGYAARQKEKARLDAAGGPEVTSIGSNPFKALGISALNYPAGPAGAEMAFSDSLRKMKEMRSKDAGGAARIGALILGEDDISNWGKVADTIGSSRGGMRDITKKYRDAGELPTNDDFTKLDEYQAAMGKLNRETDALKRSAVVSLFPQISFGIRGAAQGLKIFSEAFQPIIREFGGWLSGQKNNIKEFAMSAATWFKTVALDIAGLFKGKAPTKGGIVEYFVNMKTQATTAILGIQVGFSRLMGVLNGVAKALNSAFGTNFFSGQGILIGLALIRITGALAILTTGFKLARIAFLAFVAVGRLFMFTPWGAILAVIAAAAFLIYDNWDKVGPIFWKLWDGLKGFGLWIKDQFWKFWTDPIGYVKEAIAALLIWITEKMQQATAAIGKAASAAGGAIKSAASAVGGGSAAPSAGTGGGYSSSAGPASSPAAKATLDGTALAGGSAVYASGGMIHGPGGPRDDKVPLWGSAGEFIVNAAQTAKHLPLLKAINNGAKFAMGGMVGDYSPSLPSFAGGGLVGGGGSYGTLNLTIGGQTANLHVQNKSGYDDVVRASRSEQRTSAGAKPSWYGS